LGEPDCGPDDEAVDEDGRHDRLQSFAGRESDKPPNDVGRHPLEAKVTFRRCQVHECMPHVPLRIDDWGGVYVVPATV
jgi:hypothetical protein